MDFDGLLHHWKILKQSHKNIFSLSKPELCEFEFKRSGCNSSAYAYIQLECTPSQTLKFDSNNIWPTNITEKEKHYLESAIIEAIIDSLIADSIEPYIGCNIKIKDIKLAEVGSSYYAMYRATYEALSLLINNAQWKEEYIE